MIYLNKLVINKATLDDAGMYICFVTNSGFGDLTYKSMTLRVENRKLIYIFFAIKKSVKNFTVCKIHIPISHSKSNLEFLLPKCFYEMGFDVVGWILGIDLHVII